MSTHCPDCYDDHLPNEDLFITKEKLRTLNRIKASFIKQAIIDKEQEMRKSGQGLSIRQLQQILEIIK